MNIQSLEVTDYVYFKSAALDFSKPGITLILANNKDAGANSTNGAGKSLLLGALPKAILDESPTGKDEKPKKDEQIKVVFKNDKNFYEVVWTNGKAKKIEISKNGSPIENRTLAYSKSVVSKLTNGLNPETFYTQVYLDSTIPHPLLIPNARLRQDFFVNLFSLNDVDNIRKLLLSQYREVQEVKSRYTELVSLLDEEFEDNTEELEAKLKKLKKRQQDLIEQVSTANSKNDLVRFYESNKDLIKFHKSLKNESLADRITRLKSTIKEQETARENHIRYQDWKKSNQSVKEANKVVQDKLDTVLASLGVDSIEEVTKLKTYKERYEKATAELKQLEKDLGKLRKIAEPKKVDVDTNLSFNEVSLKITELEHDIEHQKQFGTGKCPTCKQPVKLKASLSDLKKELSEYIELKEKLEKLGEYKDSLREYKNYISTRDTLTEDIEIEKGKVKKYYPYFQCDEILKDFVKSPSKPDIDTSLTFDKEILTITKDELETCLRLKQVIDKVKEVTVLESFDLIDTETLRTDLAKVNESVGNISASLSKKKETQQNRERIAAKLKTMQAKVDDEPILKTLVDAYSKKGVKKILIDRYAKLLEQQVNKFSKLFFTEDYKFEFSYDTKLNLIVHRKFNNKTKKSDIAKLSGAEKRAFTLVLLMSTITFLPKKKRSNLLILDEPESNLGPLALDNFVKSLTVLNKLVPHIVIMTPKHDLEIPNSNVFTVVKKHGKSRLLKGRLC